MLLRLFAFITVPAALLAISGCGSACDAMYVSSFSVHVVDLKTGADLAAASLTFDNGGTFAATTDAKGLYYGPNNADSGDWSVTVAASGYRSQTVPFEVKSRSCHNYGPDLTVALERAP